MSSESKSIRGELIGRHRLWGLGPLRVEILTIFRDCEKLDEFVPASLGAAA